MGFYRKKPVVIEAVRVEAVVSEGDGRYSASFDDLPQWLREAFLGEKIVVNTNSLTIRTLEGEMEASVGDWIIKGVGGKFYPCKPEIFAMTYEAAPEPEDDVTGVAI